MPNFINLSDDNFLLYAAKMYDNPGCITVKEFNADLDRIKYIKRLFRRYYKTKNIESLRLRLVLNHIIILYNLFPIEAATRMLFFKLEPELWPILKPFLVLLGNMPEKIIGVGNLKPIFDSNIKMDMFVTKELRKI